MYAERLYQVIVIVPSVIGFFHGFFLQSFMVTFKWWLVGAVMAGLVSVPSWPWYLKDTVPWQKLPVAAAEGEEGAAEVEAEEEEAPAQEPSNPAAAAGAARAPAGKGNSGGGGDKKKK